MFERGSEDWGACTSGELNEAEKAFAKIIRCASAREQSSASICRKLTQGGYSEAAIEESLERALRMGAIDDARYCNALVRTTLAAGKGLKGIEREIESLGYALDELEAYREHLESGLSDFDRALALLERNPPRAKKKRDAAYRKLISKGFSSDVAASAARAAYPFAS